MNKIIKKMREEIASMEKEQRIIKANRKEIIPAVYGERKYPQWQAQSMAESKSEDLRVWYAAYGLMRGMRFTDIENNTEPLKVGYNSENGYLSRYYIGRELEGCHPLAYYEEQINKVLEKYGYKFEYEEEEEKEHQSTGGKIYKSRGYEKAVCVGEQKA